MESQSQLVNAVRQKDSLTQNLAVTHSTSLNNIVDLFFIAGASRNIKENQIRTMLEKSWVEDALLTLKVIFWAGNVRGGAGERRFFRISLKWLEENYTSSLNNNLHLVPKLNRWDSLFHLRYENIKDEIRAGLEAKNGLLGKWLPRKHQYNNLADKIRRDLDLNPKAYRQLIVGLSNTVEQLMCAKKWSDITYSKIPSVAFHKYRKAFLRNDESRFTEFITKVNKGEDTVHAGTLFPYQLYQAFHRGEDKNAIEAQWNSMPNYMAESSERILPICDVSGSMTCGYGEGGSLTPMDISVSLGLYVSERNKSIFKDAFITFSENPKMQYLQGTIVQRMAQLEKAEWGMNTNLNAVFRLILTRAVKENVSPDEMPTCIMIISDMEFDECGDLTNYEKIVENYNSAGYEIPKILFWNVNGRVGNVPVSSKQKNVGLVSGASPAVIRGVLSGKSFTPVDIMLEILSDPVYSEVKI